MTRRNRPPLSGFSQRMIDLLVAGAAGPVTIRGRWQDMVRMALRLHQCRLAMRDEGHPQYSIAAKAKVSRTRDPEDPSLGILRVEPHDLSYDSLIEGAIPDNPEGASLEDDLDALRAADEDEPTDERN